jgi:hypothetical protein
LEVFAGIKSYGAETITEDFNLLTGKKPTNLSNFIYRESKNFKKEVKHYS